MQNNKVIQRMLTIEGHVKGISRKVSALILDDHLNSCVITAIQGDDVGERERVLNEIGEIFSQTSKV